MAHIEPFFLPMANGARFCLLYRPPERVSKRGAVLFVPPFAEEMNKSRRMTALQARAFADAGWAVLHMDLYGCGDSAGNFGEATWQGWIDDVSNAAEWLRDKIGHQPIGWGLRAGCLLAAQAMTADLLLWQPATSGKQHLQQFLRLKVANQILGQPGESRLGTQQLRAQLENGEDLEIAGYTISPELARGMEAATLHFPASPSRLAWFEISSAGGDISPAAGRHLDSCRKAGREVDARMVKGPPFWQTQEIEECPDLIEATLSVVKGWQA